MIVLALDTAGADCAAAIYDSGTDRVLAEVTETIGKGHAERLIAIIDEALAAAGTPLDAIERIAVTIGPGSFTGIRVGVAAARGLALSLGIEAVGVTTLSVLADAHRARHPGRPVIAAMDARRDEIYAQAFDAAGDPLSAPAAVSLGQLEAMVLAHGAEVTGSAAALLPGGAALAERDGFPVALVARRGARLAGAPEKPKPLYLRAPDARPQAGFALSRM